MSSHNEELIKLTNRFMRDTRKKAYTSREVAIWAIDKGLWGLRKEKLVRVCTEEFARAFKEERFTDPQGRRVRRRHVRKIEKDGEQIALWEDFDNISCVDYELSLLQRRKQIAGECIQLNIDKDSFNENRKPINKINLSFDFTQDIAEHEIMRSEERISSTEPLQLSSQSPDVEQQSTSRPVLSRP